MHLNIRFSQLQFKWVEPDILKVPTASHGALWCSGWKLGKSQFCRALSSCKNQIKKKIQWNMLFSHSSPSKSTFRLDIGAKHFHQLVFANSWWFFNLYSFCMRRAATLVVTEVTKSWLHEAFGRVYGVTQFFHNHPLGPISRCTLRQWPYLFLNAPTTAMLWL